MRAILHIGIEKTGTTSIQRYLYKNRHKLGSAGYHVLQSCGKYESRALPAACIADRRHDDYLLSIGVKTAEDRQAHREAVIQRIAHEMSELPATIHTVLISSEHFHSRIRTEEEMDNVHQLLSRFFTDFKIICYLREQVSTCCSLYSTGLKENRTQSLSEFIERCTPRNSYFNYYDMLAIWERRFGAEALDVRLFSRNQFLNGDLLDDFTQRVDPRLVGSLKTRIQVENESLTPMGQALLRAINLTFPDDASNPDAGETRGKYMKIITDAFKGAGRFPPPETCQELFESFIDSNEQLRQKYFPELETLFLPPVVAPQQVEAPEDSLVVSSLYSLLDLLKKDLGGAVQARDILCFCGMAATCIDDLYKIGEESSDAASGGVVLNHALARMLCDSAIMLEQVDVAQAVPLMELAGKIDPSIRQVGQRLEKYREQLQQEPRQRFMIAFSAGHPPEDPEELKTLTKKMSRWQQQLSIPPQTPMPPTSRTLLVRSDGTVANEGEDSVALYRIIEADSMADALEAAKKCPMLEFGGNVRVTRLVPLKKK